MIWEDVRMIKYMGSVYKGLLVVMLKWMAAGGEG